MSILENFGIRQFSLDIKKNWQTIAKFKPQFCGSPRKDYLCIVFENLEKKSQLKSLAWSLTTSSRPL